MIYLLHSGFNTMNNISSFFVWERNVNQF